LTESLREVGLKCGEMCEKYGLDSSALAALKRMEGEDQAT
jgi:hypothetical protein